MKHRRVPIVEVVYARQPLRMQQTAAAEDERVVENARNAIVDCMRAAAELHRLELQYFRAMSYIRFAKVREELCR